MNTPTPKKRGRGQPKKTFSEEQRARILELAGYGTPQKVIASMMEVDKNTLRKYCAFELKTGKHEATAQVFVGVAVPDPGPPTLPGDGWTELQGTGFTTFCEAQYPGVDGCGQTIGSWSGGDFDTARNRQLISGGGHGDSGLNGVFALDLDTDAWEVVYPFTEEPPCYSPGNLDAAYAIGSQVGGPFTPGEPLRSQTHNQEFGTVCVTAAQGTVASGLGGQNLMVFVNPKIADNGTAQIAAHTTTSIVLAAGEVTLDGHYTGWFFRFTSGACAFGSSTNVVVASSTATTDTIILEEAWRETGGCVVDDDGDGATYRLSARPNVGDVLEGVTSGATAVVTDSDSTPCIYEWPEGEPVSRHTYGGLAYIPAGHGRSEDFLFLYGGSIACGSGGFGKDVWLLDLTTNTWEFKGNMSPGPGSASVFTVYDSVEDKVHLCKATNGFLSCYSYDVGANTSATIFSQGLFLRIKEISMPVIPRSTGTVFDDDVLIYRGDEDEPNTLIHIDLDTSSASQVNLTGCGGFDGFNPGVALNNAEELVMFNPFTDRAGTPSEVEDVWVLYLTTLTCTRHDETPEVGVPGESAARQGILGRWRHVPATDEFIAIPSGSTNVFTYALP